MSIRTVDPKDARKSYNYLRLGLVGSACLLTISVIWEYWATGWRCVQTSISAYYYTPTRAIFVGVLVAIGFVLIVIKGKDWEDLSLNVAGLLAPVVAFVPTTNASETCYSIPPDPLPLVTVDPTIDPPPDPQFAEWVIKNIDNNMGSFLWVMLAGVVLAAILYSADNRAWKLFNRGFASGTERKTAIATEISILLFGVSIVIGLVAMRFWSEFDTTAHNIAAFGMFGALGIAAIINGIRDLGTQPILATVYLTIATLMVLAAVLILFPFKAAFDGYHVIWLEGIEIALFAAYWLAQTIDHWKDPIPIPATSGVE